MPTISDDNVGHYGGTMKATGALPVKEAFIYLGISTSKGYELLSSGEIPSAKIGTKRVVRIAALDEFLAKCEADAMAALASAGTLGGERYDGRRSQAQA
jgi:excisionase family DNA binding protein